MTSPTGLKPLPGEEDLEIGRELRRLTRRGLVFGGTSALLAGTAWRWLISRSQDGLIPWPLRRVLELDEKVGRAMFRPGRLAPTFPAAAERMPRVNGLIGIDSKLDLDRWRLKVDGPAGSRTFSLAEIQNLPRFDVTTELRCIEGWSEVVRWSGARLVDLAKATGLASRSGKPDDPTTVDDLLPFVSLTTPDDLYFVGLDIASALHPQTLLCYEMNGEPLTRDHGAPLRLAIPIKYGIKSLKQIGSLTFTTKQPADYWARKGYDWYSGH